MVDRNGLLERLPYPGEEDELSGDQSKEDAGENRDRLEDGWGEQNPEVGARDRYLNGNDMPSEPRRPVDAYSLFMNAKREGVIRELGGGKFSDVSSKLNKLWQECGAEKRKKFEDQAKKAKTAYEEAMAEYKKSAAWRQV